MHQLFCLLLIQLKLLWPEWQMQFCILWKRHICLSADASKPLYGHSDKTTLYFLNCLADCYRFLMGGVVSLERSDYCLSFCPSLGKLELMVTLEVGD